MFENSILLTGSLGIKASVQGGLIYSSMALYVVALLFFLLSKKVIADRVYFFGFAVSIASVIYRWHHVGHLPLQNIFEVFVVLGAVSWPISVFCQKAFNVGGWAGDILLSFICLFPAGFVFSESRQFLPPALQSLLFGPHVMTYMVSYFIMAKAAFQALWLIWQKTVGKKADANGKIENDAELNKIESGVYKVVCFGFPLLTGGLIVGSIWGKLAWGDYWNWDPKELWSLACWLVYLLYFHWRFSFKNRFPVVNAGLVVFGFIFIIITLLWVNLSRIFSGLHSYSG